MYGAKGNIILLPMFAQYFCLVIEIVLFISSHLLQFFIVDNSDILEEIGSAISNSLYSQIKTNCFKKSLPCYFIEPIKLKRK